MRKKQAQDPGLAEIDRWIAWFRSAHDQRLLHEFPDQHLVEQERAKIDALATAIADQLRSEHRARCPQP